MAEVDYPSSTYDGLKTEYADNYRWLTQHGRTAHEQNMYKVPGQSIEALNPNVKDEARRPTMHPVWSAAGRMKASNCATDPFTFQSTQYPSIYRETVIRKDERGHYIDPFKNIATKPYGRRLMYDPTHPQKMYSCQWSSELADIQGCYSFPTTTGLAPEIPWRRDLQWKEEGEVGEWATPQWKDWTRVAMCPPYDGHDDQVEYRKYKVPGPWTTMYRRN